MVGQIISERYRVLGETARGELGPAYLAVDAHSGQECVLEVLDLGAAADGAWRENLRRELDALRASKCPLVVMPEAVEEIDGRVVLVQPRVAGTTLEEVLRTGSPLELARACSIARRIAMALEAAHHAGVIHGDLKPSNVLLTGKGLEDVRVLGFGTYAAKKDTFLDLARLALSGERAMNGNPAYISPEQALGTSADALDGRADVYALGVILYRMLSGRLPFTGRSTMEVLLAHVFSEPLGLDEFQEVPEVVKTLVMRCLAKRRDERPASATVLVDQLGPWEKQEPAAVEPEAPALALNASVPSSPVVTSWTSSALRPSEAPAEAIAEGPAALGDEWVPAAKPRVDLPRSAAEEPAFVPKAQQPEFDLDLLRAPDTAEAKKPPTSIPRSVIFGSYERAAPALKKSGGHRKAAVVVLFIAAGGGWLAYHGGRLWLKPSYVKSRVTSAITRLQPTPASTQESPKQTPLPRASQPSAQAAPPADVPRPAGPAASKEAAPLRSVSKHKPTARQARMSVAARTHAVQQDVTKGEFFFRNGDYDDAIHAFQDGLALDPNNPTLQADITRAKRAKAAEAKFLSAH